MPRYHSNYSLRDMENAIYPERAEFAFGRRGKDKAKRRKRMLQIAARVGGAAALAGGLYAGSRTKMGQNLIGSVGYGINRAKAGVRSGVDRVRYGKKVMGPPLPTQANLDMQELSNLRRQAIDNYGPPLPPAQPIGRRIEITGDDQRMPSPIKRRRSGGIRID